MRIKQPANKRGPAAFGLKKVSSGKRALTPLALEIPRIANAALRDAETLLADWLPDGLRKGKEYWPTNPVRGDRKPGSFSINLQTGKWNDFASGDKGGDLVSLLAYLRGCSQMEAARILSAQLGLQFGGDDERDLVDKEVSRQRMARQRDQRQQQYEEETRAQWEESSATALRKWALAVPADFDHPYIVRKRIKPHHLRQLGGELLIPIYWRGELVNLQRIKSNGRKLFLSGGRISGCYCLFGRIEPGIELFIVEGIATAATLHEQTGKPVAAAMSAGNLLRAGLELKSLHPNLVMVVGGDDDRAKEAEGKPNSGKLAAIHAAAMLDQKYVLPAWPKGAPLHLSDFNDLAVLLGDRE